MLLLLWCFIGVYELLPYYKGENTIFDVSPPLAVVSVEHSHLKVPQKFQVWIIYAYMALKDFGVMLYATLR